jgi:hypothetical protein
MNSSSNLDRLQNAVRATDLDGWLLYDFRGLNPFPAQLLQLGRAIMTRGWYLYLPARGAPTLIHHRIEAGGWEQALPDAGVARKSWMSHAELDALLRETLLGAHRIAMEYSPRGEVPYVSFVEAGTVERVRACGVEVVSSADLLQQFLTGAPGPGRPRRGGPRDSRGQGPRV